MNQFFMDLRNDHAWGHELRKVDVLGAVEGLVDVERDCTYFLRNLTFAEDGFQVFFVRFS